MVRLLRWEEVKAEERRKTGSAEGRPYCWVQTQRADNQPSSTQSVPLVVQQRRVVCGFVKRVPGAVADETGRQAGKARQGRTGADGRQSTFKRTVGDGVRAGDGEEPPFSTLGALGQGVGCEMEKFT